MKENKIKKYYKNTEKNYTIIKRLNKTINGFTPSFLLPNSFFQILYGIYYKIKIKYERQIIVCEDGGEFAIDWYPNNFFNMDKKTPIIIFLCGASGHSGDNYAMHFSNEIYKMGWRVVIINKRGFSEIEIKSNTFYNFHDTSDLELSINKLNEMFPEANKYLIGVSMGSNYITKYLGLKGKKCGVSAGVAISNPWSLFKVSQNFSKTFYGKFLCKGLVTEMKKNFSMHSDNYIVKNLINKKNIKIGKLTKVKSTFSFDKIVTSKIAGFENIFEYYYSVSSENYIENIKVPFLCINNKEDPICKIEYVPMEKLYSNPNIINIITERGGHIEYFTGLRPKWWAFDVALNYFKGLEEDSKIVKINA